MTGVGPNPHYVHATAVVIREAGVLVRGASGAGKSSLAARLIWQARRDGQFARLVGDDRVSLALVGTVVVARGHPAVAGQIERRGQGILQVPWEPACVVRLVIDIVAGPDRVPAESDTDLLGARVQRIVVHDPHKDLAVGTALEWLYPAF